MDSYDMYIICGRLVGLSHTMFQRFTYTVTVRMHVRIWDSRYNTHILCCSVVDHVDKTFSWDKSSCMFLTYRRFETKASVWWRSGLILCRQSVDSTDPHSSGGQHSNHHPLTSEPGPGFPRNMTHFSGWWLVEISTNHPPGKWVRLDISKRYPCGVIKHPRKTRDVCPMLG